MKRQLPVYTIEGTDFEVDVFRGELREIANPRNVIELFSSFENIKDVGDGYLLHYNPETRQTFTVADMPGFVEVRLPQLIELDPEGMAEKYGLTIASLQGKTDFDLMVDQEALKARLSGQAVTITLEGHVFEVDMEKGMLCSKNDTSSGGIVFKDIRGYCDRDADRYTIPYHPQNHEFEEPDYATITALPSHLIVVSFPHESLLDPVGFNRKHGYEENFRLKVNPVVMHHQAQRENWKILIPEEMLKENIRKKQERQRMQQRKPVIKPVARGRKIG